MRLSAARSTAESGAGENQCACDSACTEMRPQDSALPSEDRRYHSVSQRASLRSERFPSRCGLFLQRRAQPGETCGDIRFRRFENRGFLRLRLSSNEFCLAVSRHFRIGYGRIEASAESTRRRAIRVGCLHRAVRVRITLIENSHEWSEKKSVQNHEQGEEPTELKDERPIWREIQHEYVSASWRNGSPSWCAGDPRR